MINYFYKKKLVYKKVNKIKVKSGVLKSFILIFLIYLTVRFGLTLDMFAY